MKKYMVRRIGWVFDDDWYNYDGNHDVESIYESEEEAISRVNALNHIYFLHMGFESRPFQINFEESKVDEFVSRDKLAELVSSYLEIDMSEIYNPRKGFIWRDQSLYLSKLSTIQISEILNKINLRFFKHYTIESDKCFLFSFMRNPNKWHIYVDEFTSPEEYYHFFDDRDMDNNYRIVNSKLECYYYAINQEYNSITRKLNEEIFYEGEIDTITKTPDLLFSILEQCPNVHFDREYMYLAFSKNVTPNELMQIDSVLIDPILLIKEVPITASILMNESKSSIYKEIISKYKITTDNKL